MMSSSIESLQEQLLDAVWNGEESKARELRVRIASARTLSRVEQNDPTLFWLNVRDADGNGYYWPCDGANLARLGDAIGSNTRVNRLIIRSTRELEEICADNETFFEGLGRSTSIRILILEECDLSGAVGRGIFYEFVAADNINLTSIDIRRCAIGDGVAAAGLLSAVSGCTNLRTIRLPGCEIDDETLVEFVSGIRGLNRLETLDLEGNNFGRVGCEAVASLLQRPNNLSDLDICRNSRIDDHCAKIIANSLKGNHKLTRLRLYNAAITESGLNAAFSQTLCDTTSVNATYLSNHTLRSIPDPNLPTLVSSLLAMNHGMDKKQVAIRKIVRHHDHLDMAPFHREWDLKVLPVAISWFDRAKGDAENDESKVDSMKLSSIYQFVRDSLMEFGSIIESDETI